MEPAPKLVVRQAYKQFDTPNGDGAADGGSITVLSGVDLTVKSREFLTVLGPSGCGKTTLLRVVAGLIALDGGDVLLDSMPVTRPSPRVSVVFQGIGLMPWKTVWENVALGLELQVHRQLRAEERTEVDRFIEMVGLQGFGRYYPSQISGGMQQRVGLARALVRKPDLLLMDEPFGALDAQTRVILQEELLRLWDETQCTVFFITHDIDEAIYLSDRVAVMTRRPGRVKELIEVPLRRPRYTYDVRAEPAFGQIRHAAWESIKGEITRL